MSSNGEARPKLIATHTGLREWLDQYTDHAHPQQTDLRGKCVCGSQGGQSYQMHQAQVFVADLLEAVQAPADHAGHEDQSMADLIEKLYDAMEAMEGEIAGLWATIGSFQRAVNVALSQEDPAMTVELMQTWRGDNS
jgi:hypothetical protein